jgi:hypothetical protein
MPRGGWLARYAGRVDRIETVDLRIKRLDGNFDPLLTICSRARKFVLPVELIEYEQKDFPHCDQPRLNPSPLLSSRSAL